MTPRSLLVLALLVTACGSPPAPRRAPTPGVPEPPAAVLRSQAEAYATFAREFLDWYYAAHPVHATELGIHDYDAQLPDLSRAGIQAQVDTLLSFLDRTARINPTLLRDNNQYDYRIVEFAIRGELLELEEILWWRSNPMLYNGVIARGISSVASRDYAPVAERLPSIIARMAGIPRVVTAARRNLTDVPPLWVDHGVRRARGTVSYLRDDLPRQLEAQGLGAVDAGLRAEFEEARRRAVDHVEGFANWLDTELRPRATGDFRLGEHIFERKVLYDEHVQLTAEQLDELNEDAIRGYQARVERVAAEIDPARTPRQIMDSLVQVHPLPAGLIPTARQYIDDLQAFVLERDIVTLPTREVPIVRPTPEYARGSFASMDAPGPFEQRGTQAFYNLTLPSPSWTPEQVAQHMTYFNYPGLVGISIHEVMPGHFVQLLYEADIPTDVRRVFTPASLVEGWAHYTEQMVIDEGFGGGDPALRLGQLRRALQRHARWYAGLHLHAFGADIDDVVERFQEIAYFAEFPARREVERGTHDPTYLYYALGRMQILQLRHDYAEHLEEQGREFVLKEFHDTFLRLGLPVPLAVRVMVPGLTESLIDTSDEAPRRR